MKSAPSTAIVSISDVWSEPNHFYKAKWLKAVLKLQFDDVLEGQRNCITDRDAKAIRDFVRGVSKDVDRIIVHCEAGVSRSAGVAAAILKVLTGDDRSIFNDTRYFPNRTCYQKVLRAFMKEDTL